MNKTLILSLAFVLGLSGQVFAAGAKPAVKSEPAKTEVTASSQPAAASVETSSPAVTNEVQGSSPSVKTPAK